MQNKSLRKLAKCFLAVTISLSVQLFAAPYELIDLGTLGGEKNYAFALNNLQEVTGNVDGTLVPSDQVDENNPPASCTESTGNVLREFCSHAYFYSNGLLTDLGDLGVKKSYGLAINDNSSTVGYSFELVPDDDDDDTNNQVRERSFIAFADGVMEALPYPLETDLPDTAKPTQRALGISNSRQIVGYTLAQLTDDAGVTSIQNRPYIYDYDTSSYTLIPLFSTEITRTGSAYAINQNGQVVGWALSEAEVSRAHALFWDPSTPDVSTDLGTLGGYTSYATNINDVGVIVGVAETSEDYFDNESLAFVYDTSAIEPTMIQVPEFSDHDDFKSSTAYSINNSNLIVGTAQIGLGSTPKQTAFLYDFNNDVLTDLNNMVDCSLNWNLIVARDINDNGSIVGTGVVDGQVHSFLLVPTGDAEPTNCVALRKLAEEEAQKASLSNSGGLGLFTLVFLTLISVRRKMK